MKKTILSILSCVLIASTMVLTMGCPKKDKPTPVVDCYNLETVLAADFELAKAEARGGEIVQFYEAETILNGSVTNDEVKIVAIMTVIQLQDRCMMIKHLEGAYTAAPEIVIADPGHWLGDFEIPMDTAPVTFSQAVEKLKAWNGIIPNSDKMTFRRPQGTHGDGQMWDNGQYIFGSLAGGGFVAVDSVTGAIEELADGKTQVGSLQETATAE